MASLAALAWLVGSCSLLVSVDRAQCDADTACVVMGLGSRCEEGVCTGAVPGSSGDACTGADCTLTPDAGQAGEACGDTRCEEPLRCFGDTCVSMSVLSQLVCTDPVDTTKAKTVTFEMHVTEFISNRPPANMTVEACETKDVSCSNPVAKFEDQDATGDVVLEVPMGFTGFLDIRGDDVLPSLWYFTQGLMVDTHAKDMLAVAPGTLEILAAITGLSVDSSKGVALLEAFSCEQLSMGGVHFEESKGTAMPFYIVDEAPNTDVTESVRDETNDIAAGGFLNAEPGFVRFSARLGASGPLLGEFNARIRANTVTYLDIHRPHDAQAADE